MCGCKTFFELVRLAISPVWKFQFQQFKHFSIACNELFHMAHLNQKRFSAQNLDVYRDRTMD